MTFWNVVMHQDMQYSFLKIYFIKPDAMIQLHDNQFIIIIFLSSL